MERKDEIAAKAAELYTWENLIQRIETIEDFSVLEKDRGKKSFEFLRKELGENFMRDACMNFHPFMQYIYNSAPWTQRWIIHFVEELDQVKGFDNFSSLKKRLVSVKGFPEAVGVLHMGYKFSKAGFAVSFDPKLEFGNKMKIPDIKLVNNDTNEELFAEVSQLIKSKVEHEASYTFFSIYDAIWPPIDLIHAGQIHKTLSVNSLESVVRRVKETAQKAFQKKQFESLSIPGVLDLGIAPRGQENLLEEWSKVHGLSIGEFRGPSYNLDEVKRIKFKINTEQLQLPKDHANIVVIVDDEWFFGESNVVKSINELEEGIYDFGHIFAAVITGESPGSGANRIITKDQHMLIEKVRPYYEMEKSIILFNNYCKQKISPNTISKMYDAFRTY